MSMKNSNDPIGNRCNVRTVNSLNAAALGTLQWPSYFIFLHPERIITTVAPNRNYELWNTIIFYFILVQQFKIY